ncbi:MAG: MBL fold metallo-hydrolase [Candidatus Saelkia tenebricola]|nr:MBL fold metallo-hydrolase [Candidatus Saelkia tenebricola]
MVRVERVIVGEIETNCYIVWEEGSLNAVVIDPGEEAEIITQTLNKSRLSPEVVLLTHGHGDHIGGCNELGLDVYIHEGDLGFLSKPELNLSIFVSTPVTVKQNTHVFKDQDDLKFEKSGLAFKVIHTPGHTPGGCCFLIGDYLFSGDTLFRENIGRTDLPYASSDDIITSIKEKLFILPEKVIVYPGHGEITTIGHEKKYNPFLC